MKGLLRHGDWEPFLERFDFGLSMNLAESTSLTVQHVIELRRDSNHFSFGFTHFHSFSLFFIVVSEVCSWPAAAEPSSDADEPNAGALAPLAGQPQTAGALKGAAPWSRRTSFEDNAYIHNTYIHTYLLTHLLSVF